MIDLNQYLTGASPYDGAIALKYDEGDYSLEVTPPNVLILITINNILYWMEKLYRILPIVIMVILVSGT